MMQKLKDYSNCIKNAVKKDILHRISLIDTKQKKILYDVFCHYVPNKERAYIINRIAYRYNVDKEISFLLETGMELIFAAYYLRDDLLDETPIIMGQKVDKSSAKLFSLFADMLNEVGNIQIAKYCAKIGKSLTEFISEGFLLLSYGQMQGLKDCDIGIEEYLDTAYNKNGAMMEYALKMLLPLLPNTDGKILVDFVADFGVSSQIRNDIEDYLKKDTNILFQDLKTGQANFVLSVYFDRIKASNLKRNIADLNNVDEIINELFNDLCFSIQFLLSFRSNMLSNLSTLQNEDCRKELEEITTKLISL